MKTMLISLPDHVARTISDRALARRMPVEDLAVQLIGAALGHSRAALSDPGIVKFSVRFRPGPGSAGPFGWNARLGVVAFLMGSTDEMAFAVVYGEGHFGTVAARNCVLDDGDEDAEVPPTVVMERPAVPVRKTVPNARYLSTKELQEPENAPTHVRGYVDGIYNELFLDQAVNELIRVAQESLQQSMPLEQLNHLTVRHVIDALRDANVPVRRALSVQPAVKHDASAAEILLAHIDGQPVSAFARSAETELIREVREHLPTPMPLDDLIYQTVSLVIEALRDANLAAQR